MYNLEMRPKNSLWNAHSQWEKEIEKFFDVFSKSDYLAPACEIVEEDKFYGISLDIPGLTREDIDIEVKDDHLYITGERKDQNTEKKGNVLRTEKRYGKFSRVFSLPQNINADGIEARFENGVLDITLPKEERTQSKKIAITH